MAASAATRPHVARPPEKMMFQLNLRRRGISDQAVLRAMEEVPREVFVAAADRDDAYRDSALGIACGQTISQPFVVAYMTEQLQLQKEHRVLEIGTGSGYQAAILSRLCAAGPDHRTIPDAGRHAPASGWRSSAIDNIEVMLGDGFDIPAGAGHSTASSSPRRWSRFRKRCWSGWSRRHPDRAGRPASRRADTGPRDQDRQPVSSARS